jgi:hypothetical protein
MWSLPRNARVYQEQVCAIDWNQDGKVKLGGRAGERTGDNVRSKWAWWTRNMAFLRLVSFTVRMKNQQ